MYRKTQAKNAFFIFTLPSCEINGTRKISISAKQFFSIWVQRKTSSCLSSRLVKVQSLFVSFYAVMWTKKVYVMLYTKYFKCRQEELKLNLTYGLFHSILRGRSLTFDRPMDELVAPNVGSDHGTPSSACFFRILSKF